MCPDTDLLTSFVQMMADIFGLPFDTDGNKRSAEIIFLGLMTETDYDKACSWTKINGIKLFLYSLINKPFFKAIFVQKDPAAIRRYIEDFKCSIESAHRVYAKLYRISLRHHANRIWLNNLLSIDNSTSPDFYHIPIPAINPQTDFELCKAYFQYSITGFFSGNRFALAALVIRRSQIILTTLGLADLVSDQEIRAVIVNKLIFAHRDLDAGRQEVEKLLKAWGLD